MKKSKNEIVTLVLVVIVGILSFYFYMQSKNVIATTVAHTEQGGVNYKVYLNDKTYYNRDYLDEGMQYISSIIDYIQLNYNYSATYDLKDTYKVSRKVVANIKIVDADNNDKVIYTESEKLKEDANISEGINLVDSLKIDYAKYNNMANKFKSDYGISANCMLIVEYDIMYEGKKNDIVDGKKFTVEIPLSRQMINITKSGDVSNNTPYVLRTSESSLNKTMFIIFVILAGITVVGAIVLIIQIRSRISKESKYDRLISKLLKENDSYITESIDTSIKTDKTIVSINSFKELLDVRNNLEKPIVYVKVNDDESKFVIIDNEIYEYKVTRKEMD